MPPKKSLFNKPAWASKPTHVNDVDKPVFESNAYEEILEAQKRRQERHAAKAKEREEQDKHEIGSKSVDTKLEGEKTTKKRKVSIEGNDDENSAASSSEPEVPRSRSTSPASARKEKRSERPTTRSNRSTPRKQRGAADELNKVSEDVSARTVHEGPVSIILDGNESVDKENLDVYITKYVGHRSPVKPKPKPKPRKEEDDFESDPEEDDYIKDLKRQAREKARRTKAGFNDSQRSPSDNCSPTAGLQPTSGSVPPESQHSRSESASKVPALDQEHDPEVEILIKTIIPNATQCIVKRKASQPLDRVREYWVVRNNLDANIAPRVFFTWNGTRLYNSTTMRSIIEQIKRKHGTKKDGGDLSEGKIEIEAVTQEIFEHRQKQKERERERLRSEDQTPMSPIVEVSCATPSEGQQVAANAAAEGAEGDGEPVKDASIVIRLVSNSVDLEPMSLRVRPHTTMAKIVRGYTKQKRLDNSKICRLVFDGDQMEEDTTVEEAGFEDGDTVEVYIR